MVVVSVEVAIAAVVVGMEVCCGDDAGWWGARGLGVELGALSLTVLWGLLRKEVARLLEILTMPV